MEARHLGESFSLPEDRSAAWSGLLDEPAMPPARVIGSSQKSVEDDIRVR